MTQQTAFPSLYRYFMCASLMRQYFDREMRTRSSTITDDEAFLFFSSKAGIFMTYWYGGLYVVVEGWKRLGLHEPEIDRLLQSRNVTLLKRFRNGAFHYQQRWLDARLSDFCGSPDGVAWVRSLTAKFHHHLTSEMKRRYGKGRA